MDIYGRVVQRTKHHDVSDGSARVRACRVNSRPRNSPVHHIIFYGAIPFEIH